MCDMMGCDADTAGACLEASGWDVESAVTAYVEHKRVRRSEKREHSDTFSGLSPASPCQNPAFMAMKCATFVFEYYY